MNDNLSLYNVNIIREYSKYLKDKKHFPINTTTAYLKDIIHLDKFINNFSSNIGLTSANHQMLRSYIVYLKQSKYSNKTIARKISSFRVFYRYLIQEGFINKSPAEYIQIPKIKKKLPDFLFVDEVLKLMDSLKADKPISIRDKAILELLYGTGVRVTELSGIEINDFDFDDDTVKVFGKGSKERILPLSQPVKRAIQEYLNNREKIPWKKYLANISTKALFINCFGERLSTKSVRVIINKYMQLASLNKKVSPHVIRHTFATHLLSGGADLRSVQELLGHESLSTTQIYTHITKGKLIEVYRNSIPRK